MDVRRSGPIAVIIHGQLSVTLAAFGRPGKGGRPRHSRPKAPATASARAATQAAVRGKSRRMARVRSDAAFRR
jgi:hypothetical protein